MFGDIFRFLIEIVFTLFGAALLLRVWMQAIAIPRHNPLTPGLIRFTQWLVGPLERIAPHRGRINWACVLATLIVALLYVCLNWMLRAQAIVPLAALPLMLIMAVLRVLSWILNLTIWLTLIQAVLSWVNPSAPLMPMLQMLTAPILDPIRRVLPRSRIDFSPLVALVVAQVLMIVISNITISYLGLR